MDEVKKEIKELPENKHPFWRGAEVNEFKIEESRTCDIKKHLFVQGEALSVTCQNCGVGYNLPVGGEVKDGHIYIEDKLVI